MRSYPWEGFGKCRVAAMLVYESPPTTTWSREKFHSTSKGHGSLINNCADEAEIRRTAGLWSGTSVTHRKNCLYRWWGLSNASWLLWFDWILLQQRGRGLDVLQNCRWRKSSALLRAVQLISLREIFNELDRQKHGKLLKIPCDGGKFDFVFLFLTWSPVSDMQISFDKGLLRPRGRIWNFVIFFFLEIFIQKRIS